MEDLRKAARKILQNNERSVVLNGRTYVYTVPSVKSYPFQWFWDSCFHAIVYATLGEPERAKEELRSLLTAQRDNGFIPHVIFWDKTKVRRSPWHWHWQESKGRTSLLPFAAKPHTTEQIQPPFIAQAVERIFDVDGDRAFLIEIVPKLSRYYRWLLQARDPDRDNLITIISPFESGLDWSPEYDSAYRLNKPPGNMRLVISGRRVTFVNKALFNYDLPAILARGPFHVEDLLVNSVLGENLRILARLNAQLGNTQEHAEFAANATAVTRAIVSHCYEEGRQAFFNLSGREGRHYPILAVQNLMPLILSDLPHDLVEITIERHLKNEKEFWLTYPVPSVAASEPTFSPESYPKGSPSRRLWRGPTWINTNWSLVRALRQHGYADLAEQLAGKSRELILKSGFREYFNPYTGEGYGAENFGWSTLVVDM